MDTTYTCKSFSELTLEELYQIMVLRQEVFVVEQNCPYLDADGKDQIGRHLMGYQNNQLVAYTRLLPAGASYPAYSSISRVVTAAAARGKGMGRELMVNSINWTKQLFPEHPIKISAQCYLIKFYESLDFQVLGESYLEDDIPHIAMVLKES